MTKMIRWLAGAALAASLVACGGGGGSAGSTNTGGTGGGTGGGGGGGTVIPTPTLALDIVDSTGATTTTVGSTSTVFARATAKDKDGNPMTGEVITFTADSSLARFVPASGTALTGSNGIAMVQITPASSTSAGAGTLGASATLSGTAVSKSYNFTVPQGTSVDTQTAKVSDFVMLLDRSTLANGGTATAKLTVVTVDSNNNIVPGATVQVTTNANTYFTPGGTVTDANGQFTGTVSNNGDKTDRTVTITTKVNNITKQTTLQITGSLITLSTTPSLLTQGAAGTLTAHLTDSSSSPISGTLLGFGGDIASIAGRAIATDASGNVTIPFTAPSTAGSYQITASGSGVTNQVSVTVGTSGSIPAAVLPTDGTAPSLQALPNVVNPNTAGSTANQSQLRFLFIDKNNLPVPNVRVRFDITSTGLGSFDSSISSGTSTVYTNASGVATAAFIPGSTSSPTDGVTVRACYQATDFTSTTQCTASTTVTLTVAQQALAISIGDDNLLSKGDGTYIKKFTITVADAAGRPVPNAVVDLFLDIPYYAKGTFDLLPSFPLLVQPYQNNVDVPDATTDPATAGYRVTCINQDKNRNGVVDAGDITTNTDGFGQPVLLPRKADILISYVDTNKTNVSGILIVKVEYSQRFATWEEYHVRASTSVAGSQGTAERAFVTSFVKGDEQNGSFLTPPYGTGSCSSAN